MSNASREPTPARGVAWTSLGWITMVSIDFSIGETARGPEVPQKRPLGKTDALTF